MFGLVEFVLSWWVLVIIFVMFVILGVVFGVVYMFSVFWCVMFGFIWYEENKILVDFDCCEMIYFMLFVVLIFIIGFFLNVFLSKI